MATTTKAKHRILSFALAICLLVGMTMYLPGPVEVSAALPQLNGSAEGRPWDGIDFDALVDNGIYFGTFEHRLNSSSKESSPTPILWRVMGEERDSVGGDSGNLTLLSEYVLDTHVFNSSLSQGNKYDSSEIQQYLEGSFMSSFNPAEKNVNTMIPVDVVTTEYLLGVENSTGSNGYGSTANGQQAYLMWGLYEGSNPNYMDSVFWSANGVISPTEADNENNSIYRKGGDAEYPLAKATYKEGNDPVAYWLRSPDSSDSVSALCVDAVGFVDLAYVLTALGVRPAFQLNPSSIIFTSEIKSAPIEDWETEADGTDYSAAAGGAKNYKLTIVDSGITLSNLQFDNTAIPAGGLEIAPGGTLELTGTVGGTADNLVYKIVEGTGSGREIVGYGTGTATDITIDGVANVTGSSLTAGGDYTLYVWAQRNNDDYSHEGSKPLYFPLEVLGDDNATLVSVAGEPITTTSGTGTTTSDPLIAEISLGQSSWASVSDSDLVTKHPDATAALYDDDTYTTPVNSVTLSNPDDSDLYIKVTAKDTTTEQFYKITVKLVTDPITPPPTATLTIGTMTDDTVEVGQSYRKSIPVEYQNGTATQLTYTVTGQPDGLNAVSLGMSGEVSGTPDTGTDAGNPYTVHVTVSDGKGASDTASYELTVNPAGSPQEELTLDPIDDLEVTEGESFVKTLPITYTGSGTLEYDIDGLPDGVGYNNATGEISGAAASGTAKDSPYTVTVDVTDNSGNDDAGSFELTVLEGGGGTDPGTDNPDPGPEPEKPGSNGSGTTRSSSRSSGSSNTTPPPKTQLPSSAFSWDGNRTLTIDHDSITPLGLLSVQWDGGVALTRGTDYSVYSGSVIVRFSEAFMAAQKDGDHTVRVEFLNHYGTATVTVGDTGLTTEEATPPDNDTHNPNTGGYPVDNPNTGDGHGVWTAILLGSLSAAALVFYRGRQELH